ncbi:MAG: hypothetical protein KDB23_26570 [Planctomycetales bacterium]|nr:hypothetical protein [Planctomycetales bacterium]
MNVRLSSILGVGVMMTLIVIVVAILDTIFGHRLSSSVGNANSSGPASGANSVQASTQDSARLAEINQELLEAFRTSTETSRSLDEAQRMAEQWEQDLSSLMNNDEGRLIASHADLVQKIAYLQSQTRPTSAEITALRLSLTPLDAEVTSRYGLSKPEPLPGNVLAQLHDLHSQTQSIHETWSAATEQLRAIIREAKRRSPAPPSSPAPPATPPAPPQVVSPASVAATASSPDASANSNASSVSAPAAIGNAVPNAAPPQPPAGATVTPPAPTDAAGLKAAVQQRQDDEALAEMEATIQAERERDKLAAQRKAAQEQLQREREEQQAVLLAEAQSPEVSQLLSPFLTKRYHQPRLAGSSVQMQRTFDEHPMSLTALQSVGALEASEYGLEVLVRVASHRDLAPPKWQYRPSPRTWSRETRATLIKTQDALRRLGPVLVENGLLSQ